MCKKTPNIQANRPARLFAQAWLSAGLGANFVMLVPAVCRDTRTTLGEVAQGA